MSSTPSSSSQGGSSAKVIDKHLKTKPGVRKREARIEAGDASGAIPAGSPAPTSTRDVKVDPKVYKLPSGGTVRLRPRIPEDREEPEGESRPSKSQRTSPDEDDMLMVELEEAETKSIHLTSVDRCMPLITCDEPADISFLGSDYARDLSDAMACTRIGEVRSALSECVKECLLAELCEDSKAEADSVGASIFDHDSPMGLGLDETTDHWIRDVAAGTWTRVIVVPRKSAYHPSEGEDGPDLATLSGRRIYDALISGDDQGRLEGSGLR